MITDLPIPRLDVVPHCILKHLCDTRKFSYTVKKTLSIDAHSLFFKTNSLNVSIKSKGFAVVVPLKCNEFLNYTTILNRFNR